MQTRRAVLLTVLLLASFHAVQARDTASAKATVGDPARPAELPKALLTAYSHGARDITIAPGNYTLPANGRNAIDLKAWKDASIHATGVTMVFQELAHRPIRLAQCERVTLEGATLRFAEPAFTQGRIKALGKDAQGAWLEWQIDSGYPTDLNVKKASLDVVDQKTRLLKPGTGDFGCGNCETLGPGLFRLQRIHGGIGPAAVGDWIFTRREAGNAIVHLDACDHCVMRKIVLQNAGFAAFFETGGAGANLYQECRVMPGPRPAGATEDQLVGCGADGFHSVGATTGPTIERCVWEGLLHDDCIAIHGSLQKIVGREGNLLILEPGNRGGFARGEPVRISAPDGYFGEFTCTGMHNVREKPEHLELTLDRPSGAPSGARACNPRRNGAGFKIINCTMGNCRSRGILVKGDNGLIEGCTISGCGMSAISIGPEFCWNEADYSRNVIVRGNKLIGNVLNGSAAGVVFVHGEGAQGNGRITIADNLFDQNYGQIAIHVEDTDGVRIAGNRFIGCPLPLRDKVRTVLDFAATKNITLWGNVVEGFAAQDILVNLGKRVEGITGNDASGIVAAKAQ